MKVCASLLLLLTLTIHFPLAAEAPPSSPADLVGSWSLTPVQEGETASGPGSITLVLTLDQGKLAGVAVLPIPNGEKRWPLVNPAFDGKTFSFQVDNGESLLAGEMTLVDGKFEGRWSAGGDQEVGRLTMTRKAAAQ
ncbi:MAG TPA: hypothetical protein VMW27_05245 [Thermoanaerobaculia bacterium]|nr:hypothetical protein [Thermoanaerobaculia bacterium]